MLPDWRATTLGSVAEYINGYAFKPSDWTEHGTPIIRIANMTDASAPFDRYSGALPNAYAVADGDLLFSWSATLSIIRWRRGPGYLNQHIFKVLPKEGVLDGFLFHLLNREIEQMGRQVHGTTMTHIKRADLLPYPIEVPVSTDEQQRIAHLIDTLDTAIEQTGAMIAKLTQVRAGLLIDLLTPKTNEPGSEWQPIRLGDVCEHITKGATPTTFGFGWVDEGVLFLRSECVTEDGTSLIGSQQISPQAHVAMIRSAVRGGDLLMTITGYIGRTCRYPIDWPEANINQHIARIRIRDSEELAPEFALWALKHPAVLRALELEVTGLAYPQIGLTQVQNIRIQAPRLERQMEIAATLDGQQAELKACEAHLAKLNAIKQGLADDLLTGRVRAPAELEMA